MINVQKVIKYFAIGLACSLIISIISTIIYGIISIGTIFGTNEKEYIEGKLDNLEINNNIDILDIEVISSNIIIKEGDSLKIETNNKYIKTKEKNNILSITEEKHNLFNKSDSTDLIIYVPSNYEFDNIAIENGAGKIDIESLNTKELELDLGAGKVNITNINVSKKTEIDGGAGEISITNGNISNLDLDMGIGKLTLTSQITGNSKIDAGIGALELSLKNSINDYKLILDKGLGKATLDGEKMKNSTYYGTGSNLIDIDGGIGTITINTINNNLE